MRGSYSTLETRALRPLRALLARILGPVVWLLVKLRVPPNAVSLSQIPIGIAAAALVAYSPRVSFLLFVFAVVIDGIDGALARRLGKESNHGALVDQVSDHAREIAMIAGLAYSGALNGGLAAAYAFSHPLSNFMLYLGSAKLVRAPFARQDLDELLPVFYSSTSGLRSTISAIAAWGIDRLDGHRLVLAALVAAKPDVTPGDRTYRWGYSPNLLGSPKSAGFPREASDQTRQPDHQLASEIRVSSNTISRSPMAASG